MNRELRAEVEDYKRLSEHNDFLVLSQSSRLQKVKVRQLEQQLEQVIKENAMQVHNFSKESPHLMLAQETIVTLEKQVMHLEEASAKREQDIKT